MRGLANKLFARLQRMCYCEGMTKTQNFTFTNVYEAGAAIIPGAGSWVEVREDDKVIATGPLVSHIYGTSSLPLEIMTQADRSELFAWTPRTTITVVRQGNGQSGRNPAPPGSW